MVQLEDKVLAGLNLIEAVREMARWQRSGCLVEEGGILLSAFETGFPFGYSNCVMRVKSHQKAAVVLREADQFFTERHRRYVVWIRGNNDLDIETEARARGYEKIVEQSWMMMSATTMMSIQGLSNIELRIASTEREVRDAVSVNAEAYNSLGVPGEQVEAAFGEPSRLLLPHVRLVVAYREGMALSTAMSILTAGVAGIYWVGTRKAHRGCGLADACTRAVMQSAFSYGAKTASLRSSQMGIPVYKRIGYEEVGWSRWWLSPALDD